MYILATSSTYQKETRYYTKSGNTYTLLVEGTDYTVGSTITGTKYEAVEYDRMYLRKWGSDNTYKRFPYRIDNVSTLPENDVSANDVDLDAYTNTKGKTIRNRVRSNVASIDFDIPVMYGEELHKLYSRTKDVYFECLFFYEPKWDFVSKKMYRSGTIKQHRYYIHPTDPNKNIYKNVQFSFIEQ